MRALRNIIDISLPFVGVAIILGAMASLRESPGLQVALVLFGVVVIQLGVWKTAHRLMPSGRQYLALRAELDQFVGLIRHLNTAALALKEEDSPRNRLSFEIVQGKMGQSVQRMAQVAGKTDAEIAAEKETSKKTGAPDRTEPPEPLRDPVIVPEEPVASRNR